MMGLCVICQGSKVVRLPVYQPISMTVTIDRLSETPLHDVSRTYACPECCGQQAGEEKVAVVYAEATISKAAAKIPSAIEGVKRNLASATAAHLLKEGLITFRSEDQFDRVIYISRVAAVAPKMVKRLDGRVLEKLRDHLHRVSAAAARSISQWGSHYTGDEGAITKAQAIRFIDEAFAREFENEKERAEL